MISFAATIQLAGKARKLTGKDDWGKAFEQLSEEWELKAQVVHRKSVFQMLRQLIFYTPVDTGRLRGSWTPIFDKYGAGKVYDAVMALRAPGQGTTKPEPKRSAINAGKKEGFFVDRPFMTIVGTNVKYASYVEQKLGFVAKARAVGEGIYRRNFEAFFKQVKANGGFIPEQSETEA